MLYAGTRVYTRDDGHVGPVMIFWNIILLLAPVWQVRTFGAVWPIAGILWIICRLKREGRESNRNFTEMLVLLWKTRDTFQKLYFWPLDMLFFLTKWGWRNLDEEIQDEVFREMEWEIGSSRHEHDNVVSATRLITECRIKESEIQARRLRELPNEIQLDAKTAYACGATVVTLASAPMGKAEEVENKPDITASSWGWITGVHKEPQQGSSDTLLKHARLRAEVKHQPSKSSVYTEFELTQIETGGNWMQQAYVSLKPSDQTTFRIGRIALAPLYMDPPPFLLETVSYPRSPFSYFGYGFQSDMTLGTWNILADISTDSTARFDDRKQFDHVEGSVRLSKTLSSKAIVAVAAQIGETMQRFSMDYTIKPLPEMYARGVAYISSRDGMQVEGSYVTLVGFPIKRFSKQFDIHAMVDGRHYESDGTDSFQYSVGARVRSKDDKWSATVDWQDDSTSPAKDGAVLVRLQRRF